MPRDQFDFTADMDLSGEGLLWYAKPQLFFHCTVAPKESMHIKGRHIQLSLIFFSTLEPISVTPTSVMQKNGVPMFFDTSSSSNLPSLYLCRAENILGRVPMMPCFVDGYKTLTLPNHFGNLQGAVADTSKGRGNGSRLYELNPWMWRYGRGQPRKVSVEDAERRRLKRMTEARTRAAETAKRRRRDRQRPVEFGD